MAKQLKKDNNALSLSVVSVSFCGVNFLATVNIAFTQSFLVNIIDLFTLYILVSQCRSCDVQTMENFFLFSCILYEQTKDKSLWADRMTNIGKTKYIS